MDPEIEELPTDTTRGLDFKIVKGSKGGYADYSTSGWARKESALTQAEQAAIDVHGLFNLKEFLPKKPSESELRIIREMFEASVDGQPYDAERWGAYYKPWGLNVGSTQSHTDSTVEPVSLKSQATEVIENQASSVIHSSVSEKVPFEPDNTVNDTKDVQISDAASSSKANDILALIRSRQNKTA
jgi:hypothetical protein